MALVGALHSLRSFRRRLPWALGTLSSTAMQASIRPTIPKRTELVSPIVAITLLDFAAIFLAPTWVAIPSAVFLTSVICVFAAAIVSPGRFIKGVKQTDSGFEVYRPLRRPLSVSLSAIHSIKAISRGGGENGDALEFSFNGGGWTVSVEEFDLYASGVIDGLRHLPGFSHTELNRATEHEATWLDMFIGKKFVIYQSPA